MQLHRLMTKVSVILCCGNHALTQRTEVREWRMKDMLSPQGHLQMVMDLYNVDNVPIVVPNVRDAAGGLIHPSEYSKKFRQGSVVAMEVVMCL